MRTTPPQDLMESFIPSERRWAIHEDWPFGTYSLKFIGCLLLTVMGAGCTLSIRNITKYPHIVNSNLQNHLLNKVYREHVSLDMGLPHVGHTTPSSESYASSR